MVLTTLYLGEVQGLFLHVLKQCAALQVCTEAQREELLKRVHSHLIALRKLTYGKHIVGRVEKLLIDTATPTSKVWPQSLCLSWCSTCRGWSS